MDKELIIKLREQTGAGMSDCLKALVETKGALVAAAEALRKKGAAKAAKREERQTKEGVVLMSIGSDNHEGYLAEFAAETDFVVRSEKFQEFTKAALAILVEQKINSLEKLLLAPLGGNTVQEVLAALSGIVGEKLEIRRVAKISGADLVTGYVHSNNKTGALVALTLAKSIADLAAVQELAKEIAMQIVALNPTYLTPADVPAEVVAKEKEIYTEELKSQGKPEAIWPKVIEGKLKKFYADNCLLKQANIREEDKTVERLLEEKSSQVGGKINISQFVGFKI